MSRHHKFVIASRHAFLITSKREFKQIAQTKKNPRVYFKRHNLRRGHLVVLGVIDHGEGKVGMWQCRYTLRIKARNLRVTSFPRRL